MKDVTIERGILSISASIREHCLEIRYIALGELPVSDQRKTLRSIALLMFLYFIVYNIVRGLSPWVLYSEVRRVSGVMLWFR